MERIKANSQIPGKAKSPVEVTTFLISVFLSGLVGVIVSIWYSHWSTKQQVKLRVLQQLLGNRNDIKGQLFTEALNQVFIVFDDSRIVMQELQGFHNVVTSAEKSNEKVNSALLMLIKAICRDVSINISKIDDNFFLKPFNTKYSQEPLPRSSDEVKALVMYFDRLTEKYRVELAKDGLNELEKEQAAAKFWGYLGSRQVLRWVCGDDDKLLMQKEDLPGQV